MPVEQSIVSRLTLGQLRALEAVSRTGSFSLAAKDLGVSQPSISNHVHAVEERCRARLFVRRQGHAYAAPALAEVLPQIRSILALSTDVERELADSGALSGGQLRIGYSTYQTAISRIAEFMRRYPALDVEARALATDDVLSLLENGQIDAGFISAREIPPHLAGLGLVSTAIVLAVGPSHPLARRKAITWSDVAEQSLIQRETGSGTRRVFEAAATVAGAHIHTRLALGCWGSIVTLARSGAHVAVVQAAEVSPSDGLSVVEIPDPALKIEHFLVCRREMSRVAAIAALFDAMGECDEAVSAVTA